MNSTKYTCLSFRFESPPDVTSNALNLGSAGTRRTVYMEDLNKAEAEGSRKGSPSPVPSTTGPSPSSSNGIVENNQQAPATFLMYNKISTTIGGNESPQPPTNGGAQGTNDKTSKGDKENQKKKNDQKNRESAIWYEYGCV